MNKHHKLNKCYFGCELKYYESGIVRIEEHYKNHHSIWSKLTISTQQNKESVVGKQE